MRAEWLEVVVWWWRFGLVVAGAGWGAAAACRSGDDGLTSRYAAETDGQESKRDKYRLKQQTFENE